MSPVLVQGTSRLLRGVARVLPRHTKRLVLWCSLYSKVHNRKDITKEQCISLNNLLVLCKDIKAFKFSAQLGSFLWNDLEDCSRVTGKAIRGEKTMDEAAVEFIHGIPVWLRYASDAFMISDFETMLRAHGRDSHCKCKLVAT